MEAVIPRDQYAALEFGSYLNQASLGLIPRRSIASMTSHLSDISQHGNVHLSDEAEAAILDDVRAAGAHLLGTSVESVAITGGASEGLSQAAALLASADGEAVLVPTDFPSVTHPWLGAGERVGMNVRWVHDEPTTDLTTEIIEAITESTPVVCCGAVQYASGTRVDVDAVVGRAHSVGAAAVVDVTQMAGAVAVDMQRWGADVLVCSGYKWLSSHGGVALLAVNEHLLHRTPQMLGWKGTPDPFDFDAERLHLANNARRFELSTMSYGSAVGLSASLKLIEETGIATISDHARGLSSELVEQVVDSGWRPFRPLAASGASSHIVSLGHDTLDAHAICRALADDHHIYVSSRGGRIRVSLHGYNDSSDVERLAAALMTMR